MAGCTPSAAPHDGTFNGTLTSRDGNRTLSPESWLGPGGSLRSWIRMRPAHGTPPEGTPTPRTVRPVTSRWHGRCPMSRLKTERIGRLMSLSDPRVETGKPAGGRTVVNAVAGEAAPAT